MIYGNINKTFYSQLNNAFEQQNKTKYGEKSKAGVHYSETCGPSAAINCLSALGYNLDISTSAGKVNIQPEDFLMTWMMNNVETLKKVRNVNNILPNEVPQFYPLAVKSVFNAEAEFKYIKDFDVVAKLIKDGDKAVEVCIPGHYIAFIGFDDEKNELIYHDSFSGPSKRMTKERYDKDVSSWIILYTKAK
jgi:hypothetical protein